MANFKYLIRFEDRQDDRIYFADCPSPKIEAGSRIIAHETLDNLLMGAEGEEKTIGKLLAPVPNTSLPIYCCGLNYYSHAKENNMTKPPKAVSLWTKPCAALANPNQDIPISRFCATNGLDYEGEFVFVTSKTVKNVTTQQASDCILGYTIGNDLSCRLQQMPEMCGGQFFFAKAWDKSAPIGPALINSHHFKLDEAYITTRVNTETVQHAQIKEDMIFKPAEILSRMSQGTTIPAGTAVMTGTPAGVGYFRSDPPIWLKDGDIVEVILSTNEGALTLKNKMAFD